MSQITRSRGGFIRRTYEPTDKSVEPTRTGIVNKKPVARILQVDLEQ
ncbi:hypothetical protein [Chroococcidiopsis sp. CCMEE 29]|nr:hypothetical protein [Chroococcidiopsis sp. CCMEE 29]